MLNLLNIENSVINIDAIVAVSSGLWTGNEQEPAELSIYLCGGRAMSFNVLPQVHRDVKERWKEHLTEKFATS